MDEYALVDSGEGRKLERFGPYLLDRPAALAVWPKKKPALWNQAHAILERSDAGSVWKKQQIPSSWVITLGGVKFILKPTDFGHLGVFPEHRLLFDEMTLDKGSTLLNLFAYTGGASLYGALQGAKVCHLDASPGTVNWAKENGELNGLKPSPIRWIVDDAVKFLRREVKRGNRYDAIVLDPPTFGRGTGGELFKIEEEILPLIALIKELLSQRPQFVLLSCHTPGWSPLVLSQLMQSQFSGATVKSGEMLLTGEGALSLPCGSFAIARF